MTWQNAVLTALKSIGQDLLAILPNILAAVVVMGIGLFLAGLMARLVSRIVQFTKLDLFLQKAIGLAKISDRGLAISASGLISWIVKWFLIIVTFIAVADILKWSQLTSFFEAVALYIPNVIITVLILFAGFVLGGGLKEMVIKAVKASTLPASSAGLLGTVSRWSVIVFAVMAALTQLGIASDLIKIFFTGFVGMLSLAGGLAFGLGGREKAAQWLDKVQKEIRH